MIKSSKKLHRKRERKRDMISISDEQTNVKSFEWTDLKTKRDIETALSLEVLYNSKSFLVDWCILYGGEPERKWNFLWKREQRKVADPYPVIRMGSGLPKGRIWTRVFRWGGSGCGLFDGLYLDPVFPKGFIHCSEGLDPVFPKGWIQIRFFPKCSDQR